MFVELFNFIRNTSHGLCELFIGVVVLIGVVGRGYVDISHSVVRNLSGAGDRVKRAVVMVILEITIAAEPHAQDHLTFTTSGVVVVYLDHLALLRKTRTILILFFLLASYFPFLFIYLLLEQKFD